VIDAAETVKNETDTAPEVGGLVRLAVAALIEQRDRLRLEEAPAEVVVVVVRGGRDSIDKLGRHALRTARAWPLDGVPLLGISVFAVVDRPLETLLRERFATFRTVHLTTVGPWPHSGRFALLVVASFAARSIAREIVARVLFDGVATGAPAVMEDPND